MKKRICIILCTACLCLQALAQQVPTSSMIDLPRVDRNVELLSIVFRLAGNREYNDAYFKPYTDRIETHFGAFKNHELIQFAQSLHDRHSISYDAVASMAVCLDENMNLREGITESSLARWSGVNIEQFTTLLKKFSVDSDFEGFWQKNTDLYAEIETRFAPIYQTIDIDWFASFFGQNMTDDFVIINAPGIGQNYGPSVETSDGRKEAHAIIGAWTVDDTGMVVFPHETYFPILLHEFMHSFVNNLTAKHRDLFSDSGERLFAVYGEVMRRQAYTKWEIMLNEALVRAAVIKYMKDHGATQEEFAAMVRHESRNNGFQWVGAVVMELDNYDNARDEYPTLDDYMPRLAKAYEPWVEQVEAAVAARSATNTVN